MHRHRHRTHEAEPFQANALHGQIETISVFRQVMNCAYPGTGAANTDMRFSMHASSGVSAPFLIRQHCPYVQNDSKSRKGV